MLPVMSFDGLVAFLFIMNSAAFWTEVFVMYMQAVLIVHEINVYFFFGTFLDCSWMSHTFAASTTTTNIRHA